MSKSKSERIADAFGLRLTECRSCGKKVERIRPDLEFLEALVEEQERLAAEVARVLRETEG